MNRRFSRPGMRAVRLLLVSMQKKRFFHLLALTALAADQVVGGPFVVNASAQSAVVVRVVKSGEASLKTQGATARTAPLLRSESVTFNGMALRGRGTMYAVK
jgi:hypothetical protein